MSGGSREVIYSMRKSLSVMFLLTFEHLLDKNGSFGDVALDGELLVVGGGQANHFGGLGQWTMGDGGVLGDGYEQPSRVDLSRCCEDGGGRV